MTEQVSVVIITMNRRALIEKTVPLLLDDPATGELIVVIDGARDGTLELLQSWSERDERVRPLWQENAGQTAARQHGIEVARHDVVVVLDDDVVPTPDLISQHARRHAVDNVDVVLGYMPTTVPTPRRRGQATTILYSADYEKTCLDYEAHPDTMWAHFWSGNFSIRRAKALAIDLGGTRRLGYHEDLLFGLLCREAGFSARFDRAALGYHTHSRSLRKFVREVRLSGEARALLLHWFPDVASDVDPLITLRGLQRGVLMFLSSSWIRGVVTPSLVMTSWCAGVLRAWSLETLATRAMRQVELAYAFRRQMRRPAVPRPA